MIFYILMGICINLPMEPRSMIGQCVRHAELLPMEKYAQNNPDYMFPYRDYKTYLKIRYGF